MMFCGSVLSGGLMMSMRRGVIRMPVTGTVMVLRRKTNSLHVIPEARRRTIAPGKCRSRREDAKQIGQGDEPPSPHPHRSRQLQQHPDDMPIARQCCTRGLQTNGKAQFRQERSYRSAPRMPNIAA